MSETLFSDAARKQAKIDALFRALKLEYEAIKNDITYREDEIVEEEILFKGCVLVEEGRKITEDTLDHLDELYERETYILRQAIDEESKLLAKQELIQSAATEPTLQRLRTNLLDISGRNNQVNFKRTATRVLSFAGPSVHIGEELLANTSVELLHLGANRKLGTRDGQKADAGLRELETARELRLITTSDAMKTAPRKSLQTLLFNDAYAKSARRFEREMVSALQETGTHVLFLCIGFLSYPEEPGSRNTFRAPLINIPVFIKRGEGSHADRYTLTYTGDDLSVNLSLREKLRVTYNLALPDINDEPNFSETQYLKEIQTLVQNLPNFTVEHHVSLALLSFSNMILFEDLDPQLWNVSFPRTSNALLHHPNVQRVITGAATPREATDLSLPSDTNELLLEGPEAAQISLISDADSSQHQAIIDAVVRGKDMVIIGPPGTGKSQTITNLIATFMEKGKSVLFVAEKLAALEVVRNRLAKAGLAPFLLELHSNKVNKKQILESVSDRIEYRVLRRLEDPKDTTLEQTRAQLQAYVEHVASTEWNELSMSVFDVFWNLMESQATLEHLKHSLVKISIADIGSLQPEVHDDSLTKFQTLAACAEQLTPEHFLTFKGISQSGTQAITATVVRDVFARWHDCIAQLRQTARSYHALTGDDIIPGGRDAIQQRIEKIHLLLKHWPSTLDTQYLATLAQSPDRTNENQKLLKNLEDQLKTAKELKATIGAGLREGTTVSNATTLQLREFFSFIVSTVDAPRDVRAVNEWISSSSAVLTALHTSLSQLLNHPIASKFLPSFDATLNSVTQHADLAPLWNASALQHMDVYHPAMSQPNIIPQLQHAQQLAEKIKTLHADVSTRIFLNQLPALAEIRAAFQAIRNGDEWWDFWKSDVRAARALHNRISSSSAKSTAAQRLNDLRDLILLLDTQVEFDSHPLWVEFLKQPANTRYGFDTALSLATWVETVIKTATNKHIPIAQFWPRRDTEFMPFVQAMRVFSGYAERVHTELTRIRTLFNRDHSSFIETVRVNTLSDRIASTNQTLSSGSLLIQTHIKSEISFVVAQRAVDAHKQYAALRTSMEERKDFGAAFGALYKGLSTDTNFIAHQLALGSELHTTGLSPQTIQTILQSTNPRNTVSAVDVYLSETHTLLTASAKIIEELRTQCTLTHEFLATTNADGILRYSDALLAKLTHINESVELLPIFLTFQQVATQLNTSSLQHFVDGITTGSIRAEALLATYLFNVWRQLAILACSIFPDIDQFNRLYFGQLQSKFKTTDELVIQQKGDRIAKYLLQMNIPTGSNGSKVNEKSEMALLRYLLPQVRPRIPVRKLLAQAGGALKALKPCFMMSPQSVAQFLIPREISFDVVIMDEASQMTPAEALGSVARGTQLIVVGDPKQLPPTQFFSRISGTQTDDAGGQDIADSESILEVCLSQFETKRDLRWHYRSQHHSLIAFSNDQFYKNRLNVFPSPHSINAELGIQTFYLKNGSYALQTNYAEAEQIVEIVQRHIQDHATSSLGIVTLNLKQRELVSELLEQELGLLPAFRLFKQQWESKGDPFFVKNLENVQGDERDTIIISTTFGPDPETRKISQNFGPISRSNGWRRLNVLFTRAKRAIKLVTSLRPADLTISENTRDGTQALKKYLEYAQRANMITIDRPATAQSHPLESYLVDLLKRNGYRCQTQLGVAGFHIDIAVCHPHIPHTYIAALTADGPNYASAHTVRDRERIRQNVLNQIGWKDRIFRIWSPEWYQNSAEALKRLLLFLAPLRDAAHRDERVQLPDSNDDRDIIDTVRPKQADSPTTDDDIMAKIRSLLS